MDDSENPVETAPESSPPELKPTLIRQRPRRLRFAESGYKVAPHGFVNLDKALDQLGRRRFPDQWGLLLSFKETPFQYQRKEKGFFQYRLAHRSGRYALRMERFAPQTRAARKTYRAADRIYKKVRIELMRAFETGAVSTKMLTRESQLVEIPAAGTWAAQMRAIFYTGFLRQPVGDSVQRCRVLVDEKELSSWLETGMAAPGTSSVLSRQRKIAALATFKPILPRIAAHAREYGYRFTRDWLQEIMIEAAKASGRDLSKKVFIQQIWPDPAFPSDLKRPGRPAEGDDALREKNRAGLLKLIQAGLKP